MKVQSLHLMKRKLFSFGSLSFVTIDWECGGDNFHTLKNKILYVINTIRSTDLYKNMAPKANVLLGPEHQTPFTKQVPTDKGKMFKFVLSI